MKTFSTIVAFVLLLLAGCSSLVADGKLYTDSEALRIAQRAKGLIPNGTTKTKRDVLTKLGVDMQRLTEHQTRGPFNHVRFEYWRLSKSYDLVWMATTQDTTPLESPDREIYGLKVVAHSDTDWVPFRH